jgi:hypothetical protein
MSSANDNDARTPAPIRPFIKHHHPPLLPLHPLAPADRNQRTQVRQHELPLLFAEVGILIRVQCLGVQKFPVRLVGRPSEAQVGRVGPVSFTIQVLEYRTIQFALPLISSRLCTNASEAAANPVVWVPMYSVHNPRQAAHFLGHGNFLISARYLGH